MKKEKSRESENIIKIASWNYNPYKVEEKVYDKPLSNSDRSLLAKYKL